MYRKPNQQEQIVCAQMDAIAAIWEARRAVIQLEQRLSRAEDCIRTANQIADYTEAA